MPGTIILAKKVERYTTESYHNVRLFLANFAVLLGIMSFFGLLIYTLRLDNLFIAVGLGLPALMFFIFKKRIARRFINRIVFEFDPQRVSVTEFKRDGTAYEESRFGWDDIRSYKYSSNDNYTSFTLTTRSGTRRHWSLLESKRDAEAWAGDSLLHSFTQHARGHNAGRQGDDRIAFAPGFMATALCEVLVYVMGLGLMMAFAYGASRKPDTAFFKFIGCCMIFVRLIVAQRSARQSYKAMNTQFQDTVKQTDA